MIGASAPSGHTRQSLSGRARRGLSWIARRPLRAGVAGAVLLASIATGLALNTPGPGRQMTGGTSEPLAVQSAAASVDTGRIAFAGTGHPGLGQVRGTESSEPLFGDGPEHYDQDVYARGQLIVFVSLRDSTHFQVYLRSAAGAVSRLTKDMNAAHPELSPDGKSVVFDSASPGADGKSQRDLWMVGTDGSGLHRLTNTADDETSPTFSPDGTRIAFSRKQGDAHTQLYWMPASGGTPTQITDFTGDSLDPEWNPVDDAAHRDLIAYTFQGCDCAGPRLRVTTPAGGDTDQSMFTGVPEDWDSHSAAWMPDGDDFLFMSPNDQADNTVGQVQTVYEDRYHSGNAPQMRYRADRDVSSSAWLGTSVVTGVIIIVRSSASTANVADLEDVMPDGSDPRDLGLSILREDPAADTNTDPSKDPLFQPAPGFDPWTERQTYTPDGRQIIVTRFQDSPAGRIERIWTVNADGSDPQQLNLGGEQPTDWDTDPALSPDGKLLAFTRTSPGGVGTASGPGRVLIADVATGAIVGTVEPPAGQQGGSDAQPTWSSDGKEIAFTRTEVIDGNGANKHVWTVPVDALDQQSDLSVKDCSGNCAVIDDSPAFSPDGQTVAFNRKDGDGRVNEKDGVLVTSVDGTNCKVILPLGLDENPDACSQDLPDTSQTGPFQPRDVAWSPDGSQLVLSSRRAVEPNSPEALDIYDFAGRTLTPITAELPGRQKEPAFQQTVDLSLTAPPTSDPVQTGKTTTITTSITNHGSSPSPGTTFTASVPGGAELTGLTSSAGSCDAAARTCSLGTVQPGAAVTVTATVTGTMPGDQTFVWSVSGAVLDTNPGDDMAQTVVPVQDAPPPPPPGTGPPPPPPATTTPPPPPTTTTPPPPPSFTPPPPPPAGPAVAVSAQPNPGFVGGRVTVTYTVSNGASARATGLKLSLGLPKNIPAEKLPAGCSAGVCTLSDLAPGGREVVQVVLTPKKASTSTITGTLTTTGTDADPGDNRATTKLRILQPKIVAVPPIGRPGFVTSVRGTDFPPGVPVTLTWKPGITAAASPTIPGRDGKFAGQLLILDKDQTGPRIIIAKGRGFSPVKTDFLVVAGTIQPPDEVERR